MPGRAAINVAIVFFAVLSACLFGILTRPVGFLAAFWPANALLLGLFVRFPQFASPAGWIAAVAGYYSADFLTGGSLALTTWLTAANLAGVVVGMALFRRVSEEERRLRRPRSVLYLFGILVAAAAATAAIGAWAAVLYFDKGLLAGAAFWFTTELTNSIIILPVVLTLPAIPASLPHLRRHWEGREVIRLGAPVVALLLSLFLGALVGGPGAVAFPAPALLWCALTYPLFLTVVFTMLVSIWHLVAVSLGMFAPEGTPHIDSATMSARLGIMLLALGPLCVASINAAKNALLKRLDTLVTYDTLTGALTRAAFLQKGEALLSNPARSASCTVLMLDIDHFKRVNDTHGHATGDKVLAAFSQAAQQSLRGGDLFGRVGGEEFAAILPSTSADDALRIAERLRAAIEGLGIDIGEMRPLRITTSIGAAHVRSPGPETLDNLLSAADGALYRAKAEGRNRIIRAGSVLA